MQDLPGGTIIQRADGTVLQVPVDQTSQPVEIMPGDQVMAPNDSSQQFRTATHAPTAHATAGSASDGTSGGATGSGTQTSSGTPTPLTPKIDANGNYVTHGGTVQQFPAGTVIHRADGTTEQVPAGQSNYAVEIMPGDTALAPAGVSVSGPTTDGSTTATYDRIPAHGHTVSNNTTDNDTTGSGAHTITDHRASGTSDPYVRSLDPGAVITHEDGTSHTVTGTGPQQVTLQPGDHVQNPDPDGDGPMIGTRLDMAHAIGRRQ